jgi:hypothetical protein
MSKFRLKSIPKQLRRHISSESIANRLSTRLWNETAPGKAIEQASSRSHGSFYVAPNPPRYRIRRVDEQVKSFDSEIKLLRSTLARLANFGGILENSFSSANEGWCSGEFHRGARTLINQSNEYMGRI